MRLTDFIYQWEIFFFVDDERKRIVFECSTEMSRGLAAIVVFDLYFRSHYLSSNREQNETELEFDDETIERDKRVHSLAFKLLRNKSKPFSPKNI